LVNTNAYTDLEEHVMEHIKALKITLSNPKTQFDILPHKKGQLDADVFSTAYTMQTLEYDSKDVRNELLNLEATDYIENIKDDKHLSSPDFRVFGINVNGREVYIKEKLREEFSVFCVSFHFPQYPLKNRPYK